MKTGVKVLDAMTIKPVHVSPDIDMVECAKIMKKSHIGSLIVKDKDKILGIITDQDFVRKVIAKDLAPKDVKVGKIVKKELISVSPGDDIYDALMMMRDNNIRHLPVVDDGDMVGFLTIKDVLKIQPQLFEIIVENFELKEESRKLGNIPGEGSGVEGICNECGEYSPVLADDEGVLLCKNCKSQRKG